MIVVVSGIRDLAFSSHTLVRETVCGAAEDGATEIRFGGARGVDTVALRAVADLGIRKVVYVPFTTAQQPREAQYAISECADQVIELKLGNPSQASAYLARNVFMLTGRGLAKADLLLAFVDDRRTGGTMYTVREARRLGIETTRVTVASSKGEARERKRRGW